MDEVVGVASMPGWLINEGITATHMEDPISGWMQYDDGVRESTDANGTKRITHSAGQPIDLDRMYRVSTKVGDLTTLIHMYYTLTLYSVDYPPILHPTHSARCNIYYAQILYTIHYKRYAIVSECSSLLYNTMLERRTTGPLLINPFTITVSSGG